MNTAIMSALLTYTIIIAITPRPNNILVLSYVNSFGLKRSACVILGMNVGFLVIMLLCAVFTYTLINFLPAMMTGLRLIGAVYIV